MGSSSGGAVGDDSSHAGRADLLLAFSERWSVAIVHRRAAVRKIGLWQWLHLEVVALLIRTGRTKETKNQGQPSAKLPARRTVPESPGQAGKVGMALRSGIAPRTRGRAHLQIGMGFGAVMEKALNPCFLVPRTLKTGRPVCVSLVLARLSSDRPSRHCGQT